MTLADGLVRGEDGVVPALPAKGAVGQFRRESGVAPAQPVQVRVGNYGEWFGPISFLIATDSTEQSIETFRKTVTEHGAITEEQVCAAIGAETLDGITTAQGNAAMKFINNPAGA